MNFRKLWNCVCSLQRQVEEIVVEQGIQSIVAGDNITVDDTDPLNPIVSSTGGGGGNVTFGDEGEIPYTNSTEDDFDYVPEFVFDGTALRIGSDASTHAYISEVTLSLRQATSFANVVTTALTGNRTHTLQDRSGTLVHLDQVNTPAEIISGASYNMDGTEINVYRGIVMTNASPNEVNVPDDSTFNYETGYQFSIIQGGAGLTSVVQGGSTATINGGTSVDSLGQYSGMLLTKIAANTWICTPDN